MMKFLENSYNYAQTLEFFPVICGKEGPSRALIYFP